MRAIALAVACAGLTQAANAQYYYQPGPMAMQGPPQGFPAQGFPGQGYPGMMPASMYQPGPGFGPAPLLQQTQASVLAEQATPVQQDQNYDPAPGEECDSCGDAGCASGACKGGKGGCDSCCCYPFTFGAFVDGLYLWPRNFDVAYAEVVDGPVGPGIPVPLQGAQIGPISVVNPDGTPAFRVGFDIGLSDCSVIQASYTRFESDTRDSISINPGQFSANNALLPLIIHPRAAYAANVTQLSANARLDVDFQLIDVDYRWALVCDDDFFLSILGGLR
ncbi:MAG: hypothetical protein KDA41_10535, partial [Planctomycetales bacterium]|nr:hypothetical protein [Planctomycetales bacterium]